jgi:hypothetical protein
MRNLTPKELTSDGIAYSGKSGRRTGEKWYNTGSGEKP